MHSKAGPLYVSAPSCDGGDMSAFMQYTHFAFGANLPLSTLNGSTDVL